MRPEFASWGFDFFPGLACQMDGPYMTLLSVSLTVLVSAGNIRDYLQSTRMFLKGEDVTTVS